MYTAYIYFTYTIHTWEIHQIYIWYTGTFFLSASRNVQPHAQHLMLQWQIHGSFIEPVSLNVFARYVLWYYDRIRPIWKRLMKFFCSTTWLICPHVRDVYIRRVPAKDYCTLDITQHSIQLNITLKYHRVTDWTSQYTKKPCTESLIVIPEQLRGNVLFPHPAVTYETCSSCSMSHRNCCKLTSKATVVGEISLPDSDTLCHRSAPMYYM